MIKEVWKDVVGYEGLYKVSNKGEVMSIITGRLLKPCDNGKGYLIVTLCKDGKKNKSYVHRLVATAFIPNPDKLPQVNHKDENKDRNIESNLEWCTAKYNMNYGTSPAKHREITIKLTGRPCKCIETGKEYKCISDCAADFGLYPSNVRAVCIGTAKSVHGYHFQFI